MSRTDLAAQLAKLSRGVVEILEEGDGWPAILGIKDQALPRVAAYLGEIGRSHRDRDMEERRFQNPSKRHPIAPPSGLFPLLIGVWNPETGEGQPVLVGMEVTPHRQTALTRQSYFMPLSLLKAAQKVEWADHISSSGEHIIAFHAPLLPVYAEMRRSNVRVAGEQIALIAAAAGLGEQDKEETPEERTRRTAQVLVRRAAFSAEVIAAYSGLCAMCSLDFQLLDGAHIYPASAPGSTDSVRNGVALCGNHHRAFDSHRIWVNPENLKIELHPDLKRNADASESCEQFVQCTHGLLRIPDRTSLRPRAEMFSKRYNFYEGKYAWAT